MNGTNHATSGQKRTTWSDASFRWRLGLLALGLGAGALLITWIKSSAWLQMGQLRQEFTTVPADYFSLGDSVQLAIPRLNGDLLDYLLHRNVARREDFRNDSAYLNQVLARRSRLVKTATERQAFEKMEQACAHYLKATEGLLDTGDGATRSVGEAYQMLQQETLQVQATARDLSRAHYEAFTTLLHESDQTLLRLQNLLKLSVLLLWLLTLSLAVLGYRGMIAPLRTRLSESDALVQRQEKLASLGMLAAGVAHEIRNPLTAIKFRLFSLHKSLPETGHNEDAKVINNEINRLDRIVRDFLQFARPSEPELVCVPAERIIRRVTELMKPHLEKAGITLETPAAPDTWVTLDLQQIEQVLINLIQNAADSIGHGGTVTFRIYEDTSELNGSARPVAILAVTDTGKGIPAEIERRLFDPFFTTKEGGTGLGLSIAARIVEKHGGLLRYRTKLNQGTTFEIVLPNPDPHEAQTAAD
ncbi:MAG: hypothetical protein KGJ60_10195 [Verrucomicrobiota bacterium]|nr:hypothetical protein [Verrucomicrobiota bacterium]